MLGTSKGSDDGNAGDDEPDMSTGDIDIHPDSDANIAPIETIAQAIEAVMEQTDIVCKPDFSLSTLCGMTGYNHTYISHTIRRKWNTNFNGLLNSYRIKEACRYMNDTQHYGNYTIEAIATLVGYASRSHFSTLFKKTTGITAAEYLRIARLKNEQAT